MSALTLNVERLLTDLNEVLAERDEAQTEVARLRDAINTHREEMTRRNGRTIATTTDQTLWATLEDET